MKTRSELDRTQMDFERGAEEARDFLKDVQKRLNNVIEELKAYKEGPLSVEEEATSYGIRQHHLYRDENPPPLAAEEGPFTTPYRLKKLELLRKLETAVNKFTNDDFKE